MFSPGLAYTLNSRMSFLQSQKSGGGVAVGVGVVVVACRGVVVGNGGSSNYKDGILDIVSE